MPPNKKYTRILFLILSVYVFVQCTLFMGKVADLLFCLTAPKIEGGPVFYSPYGMIPYFNIVLYGGLIISGVFFFLSAEPFFAHRFKNKRIISMPLTIVITPFYFILLYLSSAGVHNLLLN